ncbi:HNH endonuclease [Cronobacter dublinensis]
MTIAIERYMRSDISAEIVKSLLNYDRNTGAFTWKKGRKPGTTGKAAGSSHHSGYQIIGIYGISYMAHRLAWLIEYGEWPEAFIDHINGDKSDNRIENLRCADFSENRRNSKINKNNKSGIKGVSWNCEIKKWHARIWHQGNYKHLGFFSDIELAELVISEARIKFHGEFANLGRHERGVNQW